MAKTKSQHLWRIAFLRYRLVTIVCKEREPIYTSGKKSMKISACRTGISKKCTYDMFKDLL